MYWTLADGETTAWYPNAGYLSYVDGALYGVGSYGYYWSASPNPSYTTNYSYNLYFHYGDAGPANYDLRACGYSVRCVRE